MAEAQQEKEKRATRRFALHLPVSVRQGENGQEREAQTRDVSARRSGPSPATTRSATPGRPPPRR